MKKAIISAFAFILFSTQAFALGTRYFEYRVDAAVSVSNSSFYLSDIFKKELVIDLPALNSAVPDTGFAVNLFANPVTGFNLNLRNVKIGLKWGTDIQNTTTISKDIFDFFANGNKLNEPIIFQASLDTDALLFIETSVGVKVDDFMITVIPGIVFPLLHSGVNESRISLLNDEEGALIFDMRNALDIYSPFDASFYKGFQNNQISFAPDYIGKIFGSFGFDLASSVGYEIIYGLDLHGYFRIPIVPANLSRRVSSNLNAHFDFNLMETLSGGDLPAFDFGFSDFTDADGSFAMFRPLKLMVGANWSGFGDWFNAYANVGFGIRYPYSSAARFYPEYIVGVDLSLFNILGLSISTQYCDMIFEHKIGVMLNVRVIEIDVGIATASSSFISTFKGAGISAYVTFCMGF